MSASDAQDQCARAPVTVRQFQIRGRFLTALALRIETPIADDSFFQALDDHIRATPQFFSDAPLVLDLGKAPGLAAPEALGNLVEALRGRNLRVFGVEGVDGADLTGLGLIPVGAGREAPLPGQRKGRGSRVEKLLPPDNKLITAPVRSGQMVVAERGDLTIVGPVSSGAEVVASGNIHIYGALRGRAMAGVHGDGTARIFCQRLDAELVAIAGLYRTSDTLEQAPAGPVQIFLEDDRLRVEALA